MLLFQSASDMTLSHWYRNEAELNRQYSATGFLLPIVSIFITAVVILLMVVFNRCPQLVAAVVAGILGMMIIFIVLLSIDHKPVYD